MDERRSKDDSREERIADEGGGPADASVMTEGVGGMPDLDSNERATISDVDGDNVEEDKARRVP